VVEFSAEYSPVKLLAFMAVGLTLGLYPLLPDSAESTTYMKWFYSEAFTPFRIILCIVTIVASLLLSIGIIKHLKGIPYLTMSHDNLQVNGLINKSNFGKEEIIAIRRSVSGNVELVIRGGKRYALSTLLVKNRDVVERNLEISLFNSAQVSPPS
jgi:hypothetical protein